MYPYRFKTEKEFIEEFGEDWAQKVRYHWVRRRDLNMDYLFGQEYPYDVSEGSSLKHVDQWVISWDMLTKNKPTSPSYKPKTIIR